MAFFQNSVLNKHLKVQGAETVTAAYQKFTAYFHNPVIQQNIRNAKEEQFQEGFLRELFVGILGYTLNPQPDFNLTTELKNERGAKKVDGAILTPALSQGEGVRQVLGVIELKGTAVTDLGRIEVQAFGYKNNQPGCVYVITSNFEKLRFYIDNAVDFEEFNLFQLSRERFNVLWLCLSAEQLLAGKPKQLKEESLSQEEQITKQLYKDYSLFRNEVFQNIVDNNPQYDKLTLFKETQKLLDRFLFIFFAEDRLLLPPNSILAIVQQWKDLRDKYDAYTPLYDRFKKYFRYMNTGHKGQKHDIFAYNGGLFKPDAILDNLSIDDDLLCKHVVNLSNYDFESEVSVNILGHIFEHSLNEIEEIQAELEGQVVDKSSSKRKKDGVFYTPKYITKYIVDNTVGKLCEEQKVALDIAEAEYDKGRKNRPVKVVKSLKQKLDDYREWLLQLTICDPACGSGAFLNQALEFLIAEHAYVDELQAKLFGDAMVLSDVENSILEHNLYGVDINNESVEIAKLSLWLRTAQKGRKLTSLNNNIKCGNSLIDDPVVAGDKAFNWEKEFPKVFSKGGFDVVIGNPPYVRMESIKEVSEQLSKVNYFTYDKRGDLYVLFAEKGFNILKDNGLISYIMPNKWLQAGYGKNLRDLMLSKCIIELIDFGDLQIFEGATTYPCIFISKNNIPNDTFNVSILSSVNSLDFESNVRLNSETYHVNSFNNETWVISSKSDKLLVNKLAKRFDSLTKIINGEASRGIIPGLSEAFIINEELKESLIKEDFNSSKIIAPLLRGRDIKRYGIPEKKNLDYLILASFGSYEYLESDYPAIYNHLLKYENKLKKRGQCKGSKPTATKPFEGQHHWLELDNTPTRDYLDNFNRPKIMYQVFQVSPCFIYDEQGLYCNNSMWIIPTDNIGLTGILNSKLGWWLITKYCTQIQNGYQLIWKYFKKIPIPNIPDELNQQVKNLIDIKSDLDKLVNGFLSHLLNKYPIGKATKNLKSWHTLDFKGFLKELKKAKVSLTLPEEAEWMAYFNGEKEKAQGIKAEIEKTDRAIDRMVYELYGLSKEEIKIVEAC